MMFTVDSQPTTDSSLSLASLWPRAVAWMLVAALTVSVTACDTTSNTTADDPSASPTVPSEATDIETGRAEIDGERVMETTENPDPREPKPLSPPENVDPEKYGYDSMEAMKAAIKEAMDLPPELEIRLVEQTRGDTEGITVIGAGYNNKR